MPQQQVEQQTNVTQDLDRLLQYMRESQSMQHVGMYLDSILYKLEETSGKVDSSVIQTYMGEIDKFILSSLEKFKGASYNDLEYLFLYYERFPMANPSITQAIQKAFIDAMLYRISAMETVTRLYDDVKHFKESVILNPKYSVMKEYAQSQLRNVMFLYLKELSAYKAGTAQSIEVFNYLSKYLDDQEGGDVFREFKKQVIDFEARTEMPSNYSDVKSIIDYLFRLKKVGFKQSDLPPMFYARLAQGISGWTMRYYGHGFQDWNDLTHLEETGLITPEDIKKVTRRLESELVKYSEMEGHANLTTVLQRLKQYKMWGGHKPELLDAIKKNVIENFKNNIAKWAGVTRVNGVTVLSLAAEVKEVLGKDLLPMLEYEITRYIWVGVKQSLLHVDDIIVIDDLAKLFSSEFINRIKAEIKYIVMQEPVEYTAEIELSEVETNHKTYMALKTKLGDDAADKFVERLYSNENITRIIESMSDDDFGDDLPYWDELYRDTESYFGKEVADKLKNHPSLQHVFETMGEMISIQSLSEVQKINEAARSRLPVNIVDIKSFDKSEIIGYVRDIVVLKGGKLFGKGAVGQAVQFYNKLKNIYETTKQKFEQSGMLKHVNEALWDVKKDILPKLSSDANQAGEREVVLKFVGDKQYMSLEEFEILIEIVGRSIQEMKAGDPYKVGEPNIDSVSPPSYAYNVSIDRYAGVEPLAGAETHIVIRLDLTPSSLAFFWNTYTRTGSEHFADGTLCWARIAVVNRDPMEWVIVEMQSDFEKLLMKKMYDKDDDEETMKKTKKQYDVIKNWQNVLMREVYRVAKGYDVKSVRIVTSEVNTAMQSTNPKKTKRIYDDFASGKQFNLEETPDKILEYANGHNEKEVLSKMWRVYHAVQRMIKIANDLDSKDLFKFADIVDSIIHKLS